MSRARNRAAKRTRVELLPPESHEARDIGPRLLPLNGVKIDPYEDVGGRIQHYLELADIALHCKPKTRSSSH